MEVKNAKIVSTTLGKEDHGIMTFYITIEGHGWGSTIDEIGNLIDEQWFNLRDFFSKDGSK